MGNDNKSKAYISKEETLKLIQKAQNDDKDAMELLIKNNIGLIRKIANKYSNNKEEYEDLVQEGIIGLIKSINNFDISKNVSLFTYAKFYIKREIFKNLYKSQTIHLSRQYFLLNNKISKFIKEYFSENGKKPTIDEISQNLKINHETIKEILNAVNCYYKVKSLDEILNSENNISVSDTLKDDGQNIEELAINRVFSEEISNIVSTLPEIEQKVIKLRYNALYKQIEIGKMLGCTKSNISRIEKSAIKKLKIKLKNYKDFY